MAAATDGQAGVSSQVYGVRGIVETYDTTKKPLLYQQTVAVGARGARPADDIAGPLGLWSGESDQP